MKKPMRILAAACALALVGAFGLAGCASSSTSSSAASASAASASAASASTSAASTNASSASAAASSAAASSASSNSAAAVQLQNFAANSLTKALAEVEALYTSQNPNITFADTQYKSSGELNTMLEGGAYADIEITASKGTMDTAEEKGYIDPATRTVMFVNDLVIVAAENSDITSVSLDDVASGKYTVAVGDDSVPAGNYANQSLSTVGCFVDPDGKTGSESAGKANGTDAYAGTPLEGKVVTDTSVGNVCKHAQSGDVDIAFVYTSDVYRFGGVKVVGTVPGNTHKNITYPGAVCAQSEHAAEAKAFLDWCLTDKGALEIWQKWGFELAA
ncbi:MAG: molybdate ABC transporter substrate-binding protein [Eggerthellaceae bacterium]|nr:molybdate ABC transporter substrate-binding protein [Eggerthellaceae bacterium]